MRGREIKISVKDFEVKFLGKNAIDVKSKLNLACTMDIVLPCEQSYLVPQQNRRLKPSKSRCQNRWASMWNDLCLGGRMHHRIHGTETALEKGLENFGI